MQTVTVQIKNAHAARLLDELEAMNVIKLVRPKKRNVAKSKHPVLKSIEQGLKEVELIKKGKQKATPLKDFLNEL